MNNNGTIIGLYVPTLQYPYIHTYLHTYIQYVYVLSNASLSQPVHQMFVINYQPVVNVCTREPHI